MSDYSLNKTDIAKEKEKGVLITAWRRLVPLMKEEGGSVVLALVAILFSSASMLVVPVLIGHVVDVYLQSKNFHGVLVFSFILALVFVVGLIASYVQVKTMGGVGRRLLFNLRNKIFEKLEELPLAFFNQNKEGDIISRINNDTDKLNQFFSQALLQFLSSFFMLVAAGAFMLIINFKLGLVAILPAACIWLFVNRLSPWVRKKNAANLKSVGMLSAEIQESLDNFKVVVAFNRRDYFRKRFDIANQQNYKTATGAGVANTVFMPVFGLFSNIAQLLVYFKICGSYAFSAIS